MARCPQCNHPLEISAEACGACGAMFTAPDGWRPVPETPQELGYCEALFPAEATRRQVGTGAGGPDQPPRSLWYYFFTFTAILFTGAMYGIAAHTIFDTAYSRPAQGRSGLMMTSFLIGVPFLIAALWSVLLARVRKGSLLRTLVSSSVPIVFFVFLAGAFLREGILCVLMAMPLFIGAGLLGSFFGWALDKAAGDRSPKLLAVGLVVPFMLAPVEDQAPPPDALRQVSASVHIQAPPERVWQHINYPTDIRREELAGGWAYRMGVPYPLEARTLDPRVGGLRELRWERGVRFQEEISRYDEGRAIEWRYRFSNESFPPGSLDDHVVIGGRYFDLLDTGYELIPEAGGTRLAIRVGYRVSTGFNWYAEPWARFLIGDTANVILRFYKQRSERL